MTVAQHLDDDTPAAWAHRYATLGLRVVPIAPGQKRPTLPAWQDAATSDHTTIDAWWSGLYRDHGVGLALGQSGPLADAWIFAVDIDQHGVDGEEELRHLTDRHGELPDTWEAVTGGGGRHLLFWAEAEIRNGRLAPGIDIRGAGGQIVAEPTVHPSGQRYAWVDGAAPWDRPMAEAPRWVLDLLAEPERPPERSTPAVDTGTRPGDLWAAQTSWAAILEADGWTYAGRGHEGEERWVRPGKVARDGISATVDYKGTDLLKVFTSSVPGLTPDATYSKIGYLAATRHAGDHSAAARTLAAEGWTTNTSNGEGVNLADLIGAPVGEGGEGGEDVVDGWPIAGTDDLAAILRGEWDPVLPTILRRPDGMGLLYRGRVNSLAGEPGGGKTWVALAAAKEVLSDGGIVVHVDYEDRLDTAVRRLDALGAGHQAILERYRYITPTFAIKGGKVPRNVREATIGADLVILDSVGEAIAHSELDQNNDREVRTWMDATARRLADGGAAVLVLDHVTKDSEHRGRWAIGSQRKLAAIDGVAYMMTTTKAATKEAEGHAFIKCSKDRLGNFPHGADVAAILLLPTQSGGMDVQVACVAGDGSGPPLLTGYMERVSKALEGEDDGLSWRRLVDTVGGKHEHIRTAARQLADLGHVAIDEGARGATIYRMLEPFSEMDALQTTTASHRVPPRPDRVPDAVTTTASRVPDLRGDADAVTSEGLRDDNDRVPDAVVPRVDPPPLY